MCRKLTSGQLLAGVLLTCSCGLVFDPQKLGLCLAIGSASNVPLLMTLVVSTIPGWPSCVSRCEALLIIPCLFPRNYAAAGLEEKSQRQFLQQLPGGLRLALTLKMGGHVPDLGKQAIRDGI